MCFIVEKYVRYICAVWVVCFLLNAIDFWHSNLQFSHFFVGEGGEEMEGGVVGAATADDGRKAVTCRV